MGLLKDIWKNKELILEGFRNKIIPPKHMKELILETSKLRLDICNKCVYMSDNAKLLGYTTQRFDKHCTKCGCNLTLKTNSLSSECPDNPPKWDAVVSEDEFSNIEQTMKDYEKGTSKEHQDQSTPGDSKEL